MKFAASGDRRGTVQSLRTGGGLALTIAALKERWKLTAIGAAALLALPPGALAQDAQPKPPADVNQPQTQPVQPPAAPVENAQPAAVTPPPPNEAPSSTATAEDGAKYAVSRFVLEYRTEHPQHPPIDDVLGATVKLGVVPDGYVAYREGLPSATIRIGEVVEGNGGTFYRSALNAVATSIVREMNNQGFIGIFVQLHPEDIDEVTGADLRAGQRSELRMVIWTGIVKDLRTIASGDRLKSAVDEGKLTRVNPDDPLHKRIRAQSPVQEGDLIRKNAMDDFVFRLNRQPGRRVDIAIDPGESPEEVVVDYLVTENKPWSVYFQLSNTGTESTSVWRERVGYVNNQLTGHDDVLRLDFITATFDSSNAFTANYEFPVLSDRIHTRLFASYSDFTASDVGFAQENFTGTTIAGGGEMSGTVFQHKELFLDAVGGLRLGERQGQQHRHQRAGPGQLLHPLRGRQDGQAHRNRHDLWLGDL